MALYAGTSGFSYATWRGVKEGELGALLEAAFGKPDFYPAGTPQKDFLRAYAERLPSVELNATFYQLPSEDRLRGWAEQTPPEFRFAVKMNRRATHFGDLSVVPTFCERIRVVGERLGPILVQLPPTRPLDEGWLELFRETADPELEYAFEFRHESWAGVEGVQVINALDGEPPFRYLRLREPPYDEAALRAWADRLRPLLDDGKRLYVYFKHEDDPLAPAYARRLLDLV
ncbi:MAG TPA: DUF72 domain-containing protein [Gaiellaceae bacterium]|nr:DUF72 domain-containing protein [Gaiellaceae bacterium]